MGRTSKSLSGEIQVYRLNIRLSDDEYSALKSLAKDHYMGVSEYIKFTTFFVNIPEGYQAKKKYTTRSSDVSRPNVFNLKITTDEKEIISGKASNLGLSLSAYIRIVCLNVTFTVTFPGRTLNHYFTKSN